MTQTQPIAPLSLASLRAVAVSAIIAQATRMARIDGENKWQLYEQAKYVIGKYELEPDEYQDAIKRLTEAMKI